MCITTAAASLSKTRILSCSLGEKNLFAYSNTAVNFSNMPNCMILPVPGMLTKEDFVDSSPYAKFFEELEEMWTPRSRSLGSKGISRSVQPAVEHFKVGMYEVFLAKGGMSKRLIDSLAGKQHRILEALKVLPEDKRPNIREDLLEWFDEHYPEWSLVACVFESDKPMDAQPIMFTYKPFESWKGRLFFPGVDSHDGGPPNLQEDVDVDHFLFTEHPNGFEMSRMRTTVPESLKDKKIIGAKFTAEARNGDWVYEHAQPAARPAYLPDIFKRTRPEG